MQRKSQLISKINVSKTKINSRITYEEAGSVGEMGKERKMKEKKGIRRMLLLSCKVKLSPGLDQQFKPKGLKALELNTT